MDMKNPTNKTERYGIVKGLNETYNELNAWRVIVDEYKQKDGQTRYVRFIIKIDYQMIIIANTRGKNNLQSLNS